MEIVNGYICMNCCDVDKARLGQDPHQSSDWLKKQSENHLNKLATGGNFGPAVVFGGSLQAQDLGGSPDNAGGEQNDSSTATMGASSAPPSFGILV